MDKDTHGVIQKRDTAWSLARMDLSKLEDGIIKPPCEEQLMPSWSAFNSVVSNESLDEKIVGFLPVIPHPVTEYATVYTALKTFKIS